MTQILKPKIILSVLFCALALTACGLAVQQSDLSAQDWGLDSVADNVSGALVDLTSVLLHSRVARAFTSNSGPADSEAQVPQASPTNIPSPHPSSTVPPVRGGSTRPQAAVKQVPVYSPNDFLVGYLGNRAWPMIVDGKPWDNGSTNFAQYRLPGGGNSYWDYWTDNEPWESPNHMWRDDQGNWHTYRKEIINDSTGRKQTAYILVDRDGPGVMDKLWFTNEPVRAFINILTQADLFFSTDPPEVREWGNLAKLGNLRIEVDGQIVYDGPIQTWFSGQAQQLSPALQNILVWHYGQFGSDGNIFPITFQDHLQVSVYGGVTKPKWFMATGVTLPSSIKVKSYTGSSDDVPVEKMNQLAANVSNPENYILTLPNRQEYSLTAGPDASAQLNFSGSGTIGSIQFSLSKQYDPTNLWLKVMYGSQLAIDLPFTAFFSEPDQLSLHRSTPIGVIDAGDSYLFYSNFPMPYQNGMRIQIDAQNTAPIPLRVRLAADGTPANTQLRVLYQPGQKLQVYGPDYELNVSGSGKIVGLVLSTRDQGYAQVPKITNKDTGKEDAGKLRWPMGYLEGNLTITDGAGHARYYSGLEDWAEGGFYFNSGYTVPPGGANRPFGGILRYKQGKDGYATLFRYFNDLSAFRFKDGLHLTFGHGTWQNNFPVNYGATLYYYYEVPGLKPVELPASDYQTMPGTP